MGPARRSKNLALSKRSETGSQKLTSCQNVVYRPSPIQIGLGSDLQPAAAFELRNRHGSFLHDTGPSSYPPPVAELSKQYPALVNPYLRSHKHGPRRPLSFDNEQFATTAKGMSPRTVFDVCGVLNTGQDAKIVGR